MQATLYSVIMMLIWSGVFILIMFFFRRSDIFITQFGVGMILILLVGCLVRLFVPFEFPFTREIEIGGVYLIINIFFITPVFGNITPLNIAIVMWIIGAILKTIKLYEDNKKFYKRYKNASPTDNSDILEAAYEIIGEDISKVKLVLDSLSPTPLMLGFRKATIVISDANYTMEDLVLIIRHEYTHFKNRDNIVKLLTEILCNIFWWNPFVYLIKRDLPQTLDIKCDIAVVGEKEEEERNEYLYAIMKTISHNRRKKNRPTLATAGFASDKYAKDIKQRFRIVKNYKLKKKTSIVINILTVIIMTATIFFSYLYIIQPRHEPPAEEVVTEAGAMEITLDNAYILERKDGRYSMVNPDGSIYEIESSDSVDMLIKSGFDLRKEGEE